MIDEEKWNEEYKRLCKKYLNMTGMAAELHFRTAPDFDRGYSPFWYITEELNCKFTKRERGLK